LLGSCTTGTLHLGQSISGSGSPSTLPLLPDDAADFIGLPAAQLPDMSSPPPDADGRRRCPPSPPSTEFGDLGSRGRGREREE